MAHGEVDEAALRRLGMTRIELLIALQEQGADGVREVERAIITPGGQVHVAIRPGEEAASRDDLARAVAELRALIETRQG